jgi:hypothetical protein
MNIMNSSSIVKEMLELKTQVAQKQGLVWTQEQKDRYAELLELRRALVNYWFENGMVAKPGKSAATAPADD